VTPTAALITGSLMGAAVEAESTRCLALAPAQNIGINQFATDRREVFDEGAQTRRLGFGRGEVMTAMTRDEVSDLATSVNIPAPRVY
jgi:hypothetical protein